MSTLSFERGTAFTVDQVRLATVVEDLIDLAKQRSGPTDGARRSKTTRSPAGWRPCGPRSPRCGR